MTDSLSLSSAPESPGEARQFVCALLQKWGYPGLVEDAALITSELATNAVAHTGQPFTVALEDLGDGVHLEVGDHDRALPVPRHATELDGSGRGMLIVAALADEWGASRVDDDGKVVWCDLREHHVVSALR